MSHPINSPRKLIEVTLPLDVIIGPVPASTTGLRLKEYGERVLGEIGVFERMNFALHEQPIPRL